MNRRASDIRRADSGMVLIVVLWVVAMASLIGLTLASSVGSEARVAIAERQSLSAELLAESGVEFARYLVVDDGWRVADATLGTAAVTPVLPDFHYRIEIPEGQVDLYLEGDDGKINLSTAPLPLLERFFERWTGDADTGGRVAAAVGDWRDVDDQLSLRGAESFSYASQGYAARNARLGAADPLLIRGLTRGDFIDRLVDEAGSVTLRPGLDAFVTTDDGGPGIDPNLAPRRALSAVPGMTQRLVDRIVAERRERRIAGPEDMARLAGGPLPPAVLDYMEFGQPDSPAILSVARTPDGVRRAVRQKFLFRIEEDLILGLLVLRRVEAWLERDALPEFAGP